MEVKVTYNLARWVVSQRVQRNRYHVNPAIVLLDTWCRLKALAGYSSVIKDIDGCNALAFLEVKSKKTLYKRLADMQAMGWLSHCGSRVELVAWKKLHHLVGMGYKQEFYTKPQKIATEKTTHYWIYGAEIAENKAKQAYSVNKKIEENHEVKADMYNALRQSGADIQRCESDSAYLCNQLLKLYINGFIYGGSAIYPLLTEIRPDTNRSVVRLGMVYNDCLGELRKLSEQERLRYAMRGAYVKRQLVAQQLGKVQKGGKMESLCRQRNKHCKVLYKRSTNSTSQYICDDIAPRFWSPTQPTA